MIIVEFPRFLCTQPHGINVDFAKFLRQSHRMNLDSLMLFISLSGNVHPYTQLVVEAHFKNIKAFSGIDPRTGCLSSWSFRELTWLRGVSMSLRFETFQRDLIGFEQPSGFKIRIRCRKSVADVATVCFLRVSTTFDERQSNSSQ